MRACTARSCSCTTEPPGRDGTWRSPPPMRWASPAAATHRAPRPCGWRWTADTRLRGCPRGDVRSRRAHRAHVPDPAKRLSRCAYRCANRRTRLRTRIDLRAPAGPATATAHRPRVAAAPGTRTRLIGRRCGTVGMGAKLNGHGRSPSLQVMRRHTASEQAHDGHGRGQRKANSGRRNRRKHHGLDGVAQWSARSLPEMFHAARHARTASAVGHFQQGPRTPRGLPVTQLVCCIIQHDATSHHCVYRTRCAS